MRKDINRTLIKKAVVSKASKKRSEKDCKVKRISVTSAHEPGNPRFLIFNLLKENCGGERPVSDLSNHTIVLA